MTTEMEAEVKTDEMEAATDHPNLDEVDLHPTVRLNKYIELFTPNGGVRGFERGTLVKEVAFGRYVQVQED